MLPVRQAAPAPRLCPAAACGAGEFSRVYVAAARALVARVRGHVAYEHHARAALEGEDTALVLHEHGAARGAPCKLVTAPVITGAALRGRAGVRFHELYHAPGADRCGLSAELAPFHGAGDSPPPYSRSRRAS